MLETYGIRQIFISGDNDVGGEYIGDRNDFLVKRFESYFNKTVDAIELNNFINVVKLDLDNMVSFYSGNKRKYVRRIYSDLKRQQLTKDQENQQSKITIILNHMSLILRNKEELNDVSYLFKS
jgi:hypothetical protein